MGVVVVRSLGEGRLSEKWLGKGAREQDVGWQELSASGTSADLSSGGLDMGGVVVAERL